MQEDKKNLLWTKDFTIITVGSVVSKLGNAISGFAMGLLVLDYTGSTFLYALYMVMYMLPKVVVPILAGPFLDKYSRKKAIYMLDFISTICYGALAFIIFSDQFSYIILMFGCLILGTIDSIYSVAYESFYPLLISEGNYTKAYSIASTLETLTTLMIPVSAFVYNLVGIGPLFLFNALSFLIAAVFETRIRAKEEYTKEKEQSLSFHQYKEEFKEGIAYLKSEKGLFAIVAYFTVTMFASGAMDALTLPYFKNTYNTGEYLYIVVMGCAVFGRLFGGVIHYHYKYPVDKKFSIALMVYTVISIIDGGVLFLPIKLMMILRFATGILGVTSYNIRISATQSYVPDNRKGRFNGTFLMFTTVGMLLGELAAGILAEFITERVVISGFMIINLIGVFLIMYRMREHVKLIYNRQS